ncbi:hypothetical protein CICLE_v100120041mg, partial [Citrus x clementina]
KHHMVFKFSTSAPHY